MDAGVCGAAASWTAPTVNDNCPGATITQTAGPGSGSLFPAGVTTVTYTATDAPGNSDVQLHGDGESGHASAGDRGLPGQHRAGAMDAGVCGASASWTAPTVTDNCPGATIAQTAGPSSGSLFPAGVTTVTYTATDAPGNSDVQLHGDGESGCEGAGDRGLPGQHRAGGDGRGCVRSGGELDSADGERQLPWSDDRADSRTEQREFVPGGSDDGDLHGDGRAGQQRRAASR